MDTNDIIRKIIEVCACLRYEKLKEIDPIRIDREKIKREVKILLDLIEDVPRATIREKQVLILEGIDKFNYEYILLACSSLESAPKIKR